MFFAFQLGANALLFLSVNMYGVFVRVLAERSQRKAFLQARLRVCFVLRNRVPVAAVTPRNLSAETEGSGSCATFIHTVAPWGGGPGGPGVSLGPRAVGQTSRGG